MKTSRTSKLNNIIRFIRKRLLFGFADFLEFFNYNISLCKIAPSQTDNEITRSLSLPCISSTLAERNLITYNNA